MDNQTEIWKSNPDIVGVEVSTFGRVRTLDRVVSSKKRTQFVKGQVLKPWDNGNGYLHVSLHMNGKKVNKKVHRLVAQTFIPNPNGFPMVNHKDCNRKNNNVDNLEFCDNSYNMKYREEFGKAKGLPVFAVDLSTLEVSHFNSQIEASRVLGVYTSNINNVIKGKYKQAHGFWFINADENAVDAIKHKIEEVD